MSIFVLQRYLCYEYWAMCYVSRPFYNRFGSFKTFYCFGVARYFLSMKKEQLFLFSFLISVLFENVLLFYFCFNFFKMLKILILEISLKLLPVLKKRAFFLSSMILDLKKEV